MQKKWTLIIAIIFISLAGIFYFMKPDSVISPTDDKQPNNSSFSYTVAGLTFQSPVELKTEPSGSNATMVSLADNTKTDQFYMVFFTTPTTDQPMSDSELTNYGKSTYMGSAKPATDKTSRLFFGTPLEGTLQTTSIPAPSTLETYLLPLADGKKVFVGIKYSLPKDEADTLINAIGASIKK